MPKFVLPASFDPLQFLTGPLERYADDARWLVSTIVRKMASRDLDPSGLARLHSDILRRVMNQRTASAVVHALLGGAIERERYQAGVKSYGYRLAERFRGDRSERVSAVDPFLIDRIRREQKRLDDVQVERRLPIHEALAAEQKHLTITREVGDMLDDLPPHTRLCQSVLVNDIRSGCFPFTVSSTGRVFNAISGLKREFRSALRLVGERLGGIDIRASQPSLLAMILHNHFAPPAGLKTASTYNTRPGPPFACCLLADVLGSEGCVLPVDVVRFAADARAGVLYERLGDLVGLSREDAKLKFLKDVLAKKGSYPSRLEDAFRLEYPTVYRAVRKINHDDHCTLIRLLQRIEAWVVLELVCPRLLDNGIACLTLHDSVYAPLRMLDQVEAAFHDAFAELGFSLSIKQEVTGSGAAGDAVVHGRLLAA